MKAGKQNSQDHSNYNSQLPRSIGQLRGSGNLVRPANAASEGSEGEVSPPMSPLRLSPLSSSNSSISSWTSNRSTSSRHSSTSSSDDFHDFLLCNNSKTTTNTPNDTSTYNTKFANFHLDNYRRSDRLRWNFDFDQNRPAHGLEDHLSHSKSHHQLQHLNLDRHNHLSHHSQQQQQRDKVTGERYQWEPAF